MKECKICKEIKENSEFYKEKRVKDGLRAECKECHSNIKSKFYQENRVRLDNSDKQRERTFKSIYGYGYRTLHMWVRSHFKKTNICTICNEEKKTTLSNISGKYKRDLNDFWELCSECHIMYDRIR